MVRSYKFSTGKAFGQLITRQLLITKAEQLSNLPTEGAFEDGDKTKLDGIEAVADAIGNHWVH